MGEEEKKEEEKKEEEKKDEPPPPPPEIVLRVYMHCEACAKKVERSLRRFEGVEEVKADSRTHTVVVKGKDADPVKICERVQKKTGRKVELISPLPKPPEEEEKKEEPPKEEEKPPEEPKPITVILKVKMHCEACAQVLQKRIRKMEGVESVTADLLNDQVAVTGIFDSAKLVETVYRKTRKQASIVPEEKKEEEAAKPAEEGEKKEEEKKEEAPAAAGEGEGDPNADEIKKYMYWPSNAYTNYIIVDPQAFSDENPNACSVM